METRRSPSLPRAQLILALLLLVMIALSAAVGAFSFTPGAMARHIAQALGWSATPAADALSRDVFLDLRLPRVLLSALSGAVLGVSGAVMQGLFRNPIVEPGLVGTSAGAALGASCMFVFGATTFTAPLGSLAVPLLAFAGALAATSIVYRVSLAFGKVNVFTLLLAGIAVNAVCAAGTGFLSYVARDPQARNITFWSLGTYTTATWRGVAFVAVAFAIGFAWAARDAKALNALMLGEDEAAHLGIEPQRLVRRLLLASAFMVAVATATTGVIAFVGLLVPHVVRLVWSSDHRFLLPASALLGAAMMAGTDATARLLIPPAELPIGIITALVGAPVFLSVLVRHGGGGATPHA